MSRLQKVQLSTKFSFPKFRCHFSCRNSKAQTPAVQFSKSSVIQSSVVKCSVVFLSVGKMLWRQKRRSDKSSSPKRLQMRCYHHLRFFEWKTFLVNKTTSQLKLRVTLHSAKLFFWPTWDERHMIMHKVFNMQSIFINHHEMVVCMRIYSPLHANVELLI